MAKKNAVWGIDIGQCALKALRCTPSEDGESIEADKYDFIEYPKILSAPDADAEELVQDALKEFLSRNDVVGDKVAISVSGQAGLSRFFKPPPVEVKTLPDIVKFEVKQQIPFPIEDVIWDWQQLGGTVVDGRTVDAEVGLFAMKREAVFRALHPFDEVDVDVDLVQLSPLAIFNVVCHDIIEDLPDPEEFDPENPPPSIVVMSMGTDTTDLIVTNGIKLWLRNIPIGGNHFTKQLSREMKLTQTKAEHLKRNARASENPKQIFKAMRPVFHDFVNEVQRSLTFFESMEKSSELSKIVLLGNAAKLPGLRQYLSKQLEMDIAKVTDFNRLSGGEVTGQKSFGENVLSFAPSYGLCLQGLTKGQIKTNLLPQEIVVERIIEAKKPWVLFAVCASLLGLVIGYYMSSKAWFVTTPEFADSSGQTWDDAFKKVSATNSRSGSLITADDDMKGVLDKFNAMSKELTSSIEQKSSWLAFQSALAQAFPTDPNIEAAKKSGSDKIDPKKIPFEDRKELYVEYIESRFFPDVSIWETGIQKFYDQMVLDFKDQVAKAKAGEFDDPTETLSEIDEFAEIDPNAGWGGGSSDFDDEDQAPVSVAATDGGWIVEIKGHHFHNSDVAMRNLRSEKQYLMETLIQNLRFKKNVKLPSHPDKDFTYADLGVTFPTITWVSSSAEETEIIFDPTAADGGMSDVDGGAGGAGGKFSGGGGMGMGGMGAGGPSEGASGRPGGLSSTTDEDTANIYKVRKFKFIVQMAWRPRSDEEIIAAYNARIEEEKKAEEARATAADEAAEATEE
ncbi:MAG: type IV pilus assembly protein PilM [Planctomycetota bacterium]